MGRDEKANNVFLIDYGLSKRYRDKETKEHIPFRESKQLTGTAKFCSLNTHLGYEQSRRDDLESLCYSLIYLMKGNLPWQGKKLSSKEKTYDTIMDAKTNIQVARLCKGLPVEFERFICYCRSLMFDAKPDYLQLKKQFQDCYTANWGKKGFEYDWVRLKVDFAKIEKFVTPSSHKADCPAVRDKNSKNSPEIKEKKEDRKKQIEDLISGLPKKMRTISGQRASVAIPSMPLLSRTIVVKPAEETKKIAIIEEDSDSDSSSCNLTPKELFEHNSLLGSASFFNKM